MHKHLFFLPLIILQTFTTTTHSHIIHVPGDSTTIQGWINGVVDGDTVMVARGTYYERDIDFLGKAVLLESIKGPMFTSVVRD